MELDQIVADLEKKLFALKLEYEKYFQGESRRAPLRARAEMQKAIEKLVAARVTATSIKHRVQTITNKYYALANFWDRTMGQIEAGTYAPDRFKADLRVGRLSEVLDASRKEEEQKKADWRAARDAEKAPRPATAAPAPETGSPDQRMRKLYGEFIKNRRENGESTAIPYESFLHSIEKQRPELEKKLGKKVDFKIAVENGKTKVKSFSAG